jgi:hypothetical protein
VKSGINLASRPNRSAESSMLVRLIPLLLLLGVSLLHLYGALALRARAAETSRSLARQEERLRELERQITARRLELDSAAALATLRQFAAQDRAGVARSVSFAQVLSAVSAAFPAEARAHSLAVVPTAQGPLLTLEVTGAGPETASELVERLSRSPTFREPEVLDERLLPNGETRFRVRAGVRKP